MPVTVHPSRQTSTELSVPQKKYYQETKQKSDRDKMNPVYKRFFDIEDSVKANRLETRERAIANGWDTKIDENGHVVTDDAVQKKHNFHYNLWEMGKGGPKTRYQWSRQSSAPSLRTPFLFL